MAIAPWVVRAKQPVGSLLLGPRLRLLRIGDQIQPSDLWSEGHRDFLCRTQEAAVDSVRESDSALSEAELILVDRTLRGAASQLRPLLQQHGWSVAIVQSTDDELLSAAVRGIPAMVVTDREDMDPPRWLAALVEHHPVIWVGECDEGTHVGPLLNHEHDIDQYYEATTKWCSDRKLRELGFRERPVPLITDPDRTARVAAATHLLLCSLKGTGGQVAVSDGYLHLIDQARPVKLWTDTVARPVPTRLLRAEQAWSKGLLRDLHIVTGRSTGVKLAACRISTGAMLPELESVSGKGLTQDLAMTRAIGEAVERFGAWRANDLPVSRLGPHDRMVPLTAFHPFGPLYDRYLETGAPEVRYVRGLSLTTGETVHVPLVLTAFPFAAPSDECRPSWGVTTGLAAHTDRKTAILRGLREILESDSLYSNFFWQRRGRRLSLPTKVRIVIEEPHRKWFLVSYERYPLPIVQAFTFEQSEQGWIGARGSGSNLSWEDAAVNSVEEAEQVMAQVRRGAPNHMGTGFSNWATPAVCEHAISYLERQPYASEVGPEHTTARQQFDSILEWLAAERREAIVVDLPCPVAGWSVVRVLITGAVLHGHASSSAGGRRLVGAPWQFRLPG